MKTEFNAWDEGNKIMHTNVSFIKTGDEGNDWIVFSSDLSPYKAEPSRIYFDNPYFSQQIKVIRKSPIKDTNGIELCEGDMILDLLTKIGYIVKYGFCKKKAFTGWYVENPNDGYITTLNNNQDEGQNNCIEYRGNIYQNKELIERL